MSKNYTDVIVFSFGCKDDFQYANALRKKYPNLYHVVLTSDPDATDLSALRAEYPHLAHTIVDINDIKEDGTGAGIPPKLPCIISNSTKVIIRAHGLPNWTYIVSSASEQVTMRELAMLLKRNCGENQNMQIAFHVCCAGRGDAVNRVEGSVAKTLYDQLAELEIKSTISAHTSFLGFDCKNARKYVMPITMAAEYNTYRRIYGFKGTEPEDIQSLSIFSWQQPREKFQELYDTEKLLLKKPLYKSIGSKVVIASVEDASNHSESYIIENNVAIEFPYGQFESSAIAATDDEEVKIIYHYSDQQKEYRVEAREICQGHLDSIVAQYPNIKEYEEFNTLQDIITCHLYLYPPLLSHLVNNLIGAIKKSDNGCSVALSEFKDKINDDKVLSNIQDNHMALAKEMGNAYRDFQKKRTAQKAQKSETTVASANTYSFHSRQPQTQIDENYIKMGGKRPYG